MKIKDVFLLEEVIDDLNEGKEFYDQKEPGVGEYFWDSLIADIESLVIYASIHRKNTGCIERLLKDFLMPFTTIYQSQLRMLLQYYPCVKIQVG